MKKILITEDDKTYAYALETYLKEAHYETLWVPDGIRGFLRANLWHPDVILMDVNLGTCSGFEVAKEILDTKIPIIFITASDSPQYVEEAKKFNAVAFFHKPFDVNKLIETIKKTIRGTLPEGLLVV